MTSRIPSRSRFVAAQCVLVLAGLAACVLRPPGSGRMLMVPLLERQGGAAVRLALRSGASLIGTGPVRGSIVIRGERARLEAAALAAGVMLLAAPRAGCGGFAGERRT